MNLLKDYLGNFTSSPVVRNHVCKDYLTQFSLGDGRLEVGKRPVDDPSGQLDCTMMSTYFNDLTLGGYVL